MGITPITNIEDVYKDSQIIDIQYEEHQKDTLKEERRRKFINNCQNDNEQIDEYVEERRRMNNEYNDINQIKKCQIDNDCTDDYDEERSKNYIERTPITDVLPQNDQKCNEDLFSDIIDFKTQYDEYFDDHMLYKTIKMCEGYCIDFFEPSNNKTKCYFNNLLYESKQKHSLISNESKQKQKLISN